MDGSTGRLLRLGAAGENAQFDPGLKYAGQWLDEESGLVYNRHRYYSPMVGCYLTLDPIGLLGGLNPYSYIKNPTRFIDPLGLAGKECLKLSSTNPVPKSVRNEYENIITGKGGMYSTCCYSGILAIFDEGELSGNG
ncbi:RHS repeat-associated core domain-containing protein [Xenorhabdus khoisanae]|uniref:RHS repeat-associated core domain-containing protein n=1 Tax=Xenorhabdus khoisanae TaxID=880157 RepID=UPI0032B82406